MEGRIVVDRRSQFRCSNSAGVFHEIFRFDLYVDGNETNPGGTMNLTKVTTIFLLTISS